MARGFGRTKNGVKKLNRRRFLYAVEHYHNHTMTLMDCAGICKLSYPTFLARVREFDAGTLDSSIFMTAEEEMEDERVRYGIQRLTDLR